MVVTHAFRASAAKPTGRRRTGRMRGAARGLDRL